MSNLGDQTAPVEKDRLNSLLPAPKSAGWKSRIFSIALSARTHCLVLLLIVIACFGRTLTSYFLADDFGEIAYVSHIFNGEPELLWKNFTGNYMQIQGMNVYRPWLLMTLVFDYLIWHGNAAGYYLTNLLYFACDVLLVYAITRKLTASWTAARSGLASFFAACLFAASPLHCESISWVVGRVDAACCFYYLLSFYLFLKALARPSRLVVAAGTASFCLALLVKEMAIGLPVAVTACAFFFPKGQDEMLSESESCRQKLLRSLRFSLPLWLTTAAYFAVRYLALGTFLGGYAGAIGDAQSAAALDRWLDPDSLKRFLFPFAHSIFNEHCLYESLLAGTYIVLVALICLRALARELSYKWLAFIFVWGLTCALPIYRLWGIGFDLEGARFAFFLTVPACVLLPVLCFYPAARQYTAALEHRLMTVSTIALALLVVILSKAAYATNVSWVHAGKEINAVRGQAVALAASSPADRRLIVLGIPKQHCGAHMILNGETFQFMLNPPFTTPPIAHRFLTFDPVLFGPPDLINASRFKSQLFSGRTRGPYVWTGAHSGFKENPLSQGPVAAPLCLSLPVPSKRAGQADSGNMSRGTQSWLPFSQGHASCQLTGEGLQFRNVCQGDGLSLSGQNLNPLAYDFLEFQVKSKTEGLSQTFACTWKGSNAAGSGSACEQETPARALTILEHLPPTSPGSAEFTTARIRLSSYWRWFTCGSIQELMLALPPSSSMTIRNIKLVSADILTPKLTVSGPSAIATGVYPISSSPFVLNVDASRLAGARGLQIEISRPNFFFDRYTGSRQAEAIAETININGPSGRIELKPDRFKTNGYFEIRARAQAANGPCGEYSDTIVFLK